MKLIRIIHQGAWVLLLCLGLEAAHAATGAPAQVLVENTTGKVMAVLREERGVIQSNPERVYELVDEYIAPHFDLNRMSRRVLGKHWRAASPEQRERFLGEFKTLLTRTYATALRQYSDETVSFLPTKARKRKNEVSVRTQINLSDGPPIPINYEMYLDGEAWKVFDVRIDGVSLVINYRSEFSNEVRKGGMDGLIGAISKHNQKSAGR